VCASKGGADHHPAWYLNVIEMDEIAFQIGTQAFRATWRVAEGEERKKVWDFMVDVFPAYRDYQASTDRELPLVMFKAIEPVDVFRAE
jgi:deazaflavin-dependent oxidoreductase (nitroreductase family)